MLELVEAARVWIWWKVEEQAHVGEVGALLLFWLFVVVGAGATGGRSQCFFENTGTSIKAQ